MKGKLKIPTTVLSVLQLMATQFHRLSGGRLTIKQFQFFEDQSSFICRKEVKIRFINRGETVVVIDESIYLASGEAYVEGDDLGPGIDHEYNIRFLSAGTTPPDDGQKNANAADDFTFIAEGNLLDVRALYRNY